MASEIEPAAGGPADVVTNFAAGRTRGEAWARAALEGVRTADEAITAEAVQQALGADRGERARGFLSGVYEVVLGLAPAERPRVLFEVSDEHGRLQVDQLPMGMWARFKSAFG